MSSRLGVEEVGGGLVTVLVVRGCGSRKGSYGCCEQRRGESRQPSSVFM
ncbi:MAG: hypothetical protein ACLTSZ_19335 [Lachnospiraceae bacterium]